MGTEVEKGTKETLVLKDLPPGWGGNGLPKAKPQKKKRSRHGKKHHRIKEGSGGLVAGGTSYCPEGRPNAVKRTTEIRGSATPSVPTNRERECQSAKKM